MDINASIILAQVKAAANRTHSPGGVPTSLADLGYATVGIDAGWAACGKGVNGSYHDSDGNPIIDTSRFPDMRGLVHLASTLYNISMGWYMNCCGCEAEHALSKPHYMEDARATAALGFVSLKVDGCGNEPNITAWAQGLNSTGQGIVLENCNDDDPFRPVRLPDGSVNCPYNLFRTSIDQAPSFTSTMWNLWETVPFLALGAPGCFPYPDMLTVGTPAWTRDCGQGHGCYPNAGCGGVRLSFAAARAQFAAVAVVSSPLTLGYDISNRTEYDMWWPIVSHREVLEINSAWAGEVGRLLAHSPRNYTGPVPHGAACEVIQNHTMPVWLALGKLLANRAFAAVIVNGGFEGAIDAEISITSMGYKKDEILSVREVWSGQSLGVIKDGVWHVHQLPAETDLFVVFTPVA